MIAIESEETTALAAQPKHSLPVFENGDGAGKRP